MPNWPKFQHYHDRVPPWLKLYVELSANAHWIDLNLASRGLLVSIWIEYARSRGQLNTHFMRRCCPSSEHPHAITRAFTSLSDAGFIEFRSSMPAPLALEQKKIREEKSKKADFAHAQKAKSDEPRSNAAAYQRYDHDAPLTDAELADLNRV